MKIYLTTQKNTHHERRCAKINYFHKTNGRNESKESVEPIELVEAICEDS